MRIIKTVNEAVKILKNILSKEILDELKADRQSSEIFLIKPKIPYWNIIFLYSYITWSNFNFTV